MRTKAVRCVQKEADLVPQGAYPARLVAVRRFGNAYGPRVGLDFQLQDGAVVTASCSPSASTQGKLAELLRGLLGREPAPGELAEPSRLTGTACKVLVRTEATRNGTTYSNVATVFR